MRSLAVKLTLAFLFVGVIAVALIGVFVSLRTQSAYDRWMVDQRLALLETQLESYYETNGSWAGVETLLRRGHSGNGMMDMGGLSAALLDERRMPVVGLGEFSSPNRVTRRWYSALSRSVTVWRRAVPSTCVIASTSARFSGRTSQTSSM